MTEGALVLEGGSLRCLFTAGVLDVLMEKKLELSYVIGVSAGSLCGMNYVSKQIGRSAKVNLDYVNDNRYLGIRNLIRGRSIFNFDFLFQDIAKELLPFDEETFFHSKQRYIAVATSIKDGKERYYDTKNCSDIMYAARASCSMPLLSRIVMVDQEPCLDGGIAMPIPFRRAIEDGNQKIVLVLTREAGYRKREQGRGMKRAYQLEYKHYPELIKRLDCIPAQYNEAQEEIEKLSKEGRIFIIRPTEPVTVSRVEKDVNKLKALYEIGREQAILQYDALMNYLEA